MANNNASANLGYSVTTRNISFEALVIEAWGSEWKQRQMCYRFSNGRRFVDNDNTKLGIYGITSPNGFRLLMEPLMQPAYGDMIQDAIAMDPGLSTSPGNSGEIEQG